ncbi:MAG: glycosyltransferase [Anaerolineae bacterium]|nr:glycosyltransferase [Anaerolineae bacterium]
MTLVSIIIPTCNRAVLLRKAIESALAQTYHPLEVIVVDDGSTDNTAEVVAEFREQIIYLHQPNTGVSVARNRGLRASKGEYIAFLDDDDLYLPQKIERQMTWMYAHPQLGLVHCRYFLSNQSGAIVERIGTLPTGQVLPELFYNNFLWMSAPLIPRRVLEQIGGFDEELSAAADYDLWVRIAQAGYPFGCVQELLGVYRLQAGSMVTNVIRTEREIISILDRVFAEPQFQSYKVQAYISWRLWLAHRHYAAKNWTDACHNLTEILTLEPHLSPEVIIDNLYEHALDERVPDPFDYIKDVFNHLPPVAQFLRDFTDSLQRRLQLAVALRCYQYDDLTWAQQQLSEAALLYPTITSMEPDFMQISCAYAMCLPVDVDDYVNTIFANLPPSAQSLIKLKSRVQSNVAIARAFEDYHNGLRGLAATRVFSAIRTQPAWIRNRGVQAMLFKSLPTWLKEKR